MSDDANSFELKRQADQKLFDTLKAAGVRGRAMDSLEADLQARLKLRGDLVRRKAASQDDVNAQEEVGKLPAKTIQRELAKQKRRTAEDAIDKTTTQIEAHSAGLKAEKTLKRKQMANDALRISRMIREKQVELDELRKRLEEAE